MPKNKNFKFHIPIELTKGTKQQGSEGFWNIKGIASTGDMDLQGETVLQDGLDISTLKAGRGLFNYDHNKGPENVLGQIEDAEFVKSGETQSLQVNGYLFKDVERAKAFRNILKSLKKGASPRVHMSIEGKILKRDPFDSKQISRARIDKVALTLDPVNPNTFAELVKSLNGPEDEEVTQDLDNTSEMVEISKVELERLIGVAEKALASGAGYTKAPEARTGGEAMSKESMQRDATPKSVTYDKNKKKSRKDMVKSVIEGLRKAHPEHDPLELAEWVIEAFIEKFNKESNSA